MKDRIECRCIKCDNVFTHVFQGIENPSPHRPRPIECPKCGSIELEYNEIDTVLTDYPVCPYCGFSHIEWSFEMCEDGVYTCMKCGEEFALSVQTTTQFTTAQIETEGE